MEQADVQAQVIDALGVVTDLLVTTDFVFSTLDVPLGQEGNGFDGGAITLNVAIENSSIRIFRDTVIDRTANYPTTGPFSMPLLNDEQNQQTMILQESLAKTLLAIRAPVKDVGANMVLPAALVRAGEFLVFDASGGVSTSLGSGGGDTSLRTDLASTDSGKGFHLLAIVKSAEEIAEGVTIVNAYYPVGMADRYGTNTTPGTTNMQAAIQAALNVRNRGGGGKVALLPVAYAHATGLTVYGGTILTGEGLGQRYEPAQPHTGTVLIASASMAVGITTDENTDLAGMAVIENLIIDGNNLATDALLMLGIKDTLRDARVMRGLTNGIHQNQGSTSSQVIQNVRITMDERGTGLWCESGSDHEYLNLIVHGAYTSVKLESGGHQFTSFHPYPAALDPGSPSIITLLDIVGTGDNYFVNCHFDQIHTAGTSQVRIRTTANTSCLENIFVGCSFDNPGLDNDDVVSGVFMDASLGSNKWITASFTNCHFSGNGTFKYQYAFEKNATGAARVIYHVQGGWLNNGNALWSHAPTSVWGFHHLSGGFVEVASPQSIVDNLTINTAISVTGKIVAADAGELTIASGLVTVSGSHHTIDTQDDDATDDLNTISGGTIGQILYLTAANGARTIVLKDGVDNLQLAGDCTLDSGADTITLLLFGVDWKEIARSDNAV